MHWAAAGGNVEVLKWLMRAGLNMGHINDAGHGAVNKAAWKGHDTALRWLLVDKMGPLLIEQLSLPDQQGYLVAQAARKGGHEKIASWIEELQRKCSL